MCTHKIGNKQKIIIIGESPQALKDIKGLGLFFYQVSLQSYLPSLDKNTNFINSNSVIFSAIIAKVQLSVIGSSIMFWFLSVIDNYKKRKELKNSLENNIEDRKSEMLYRICYRIVNLCTYKGYVLYKNLQEYCFTRI